MNYKNIYYIMKHQCKHCDFETTILSKYLRHIQTNKHKSKIESIKKEGYEKK